MDEKITTGLRRGRALYEAGELNEAIAEWKQALAHAYVAQSHAVAFVLSKNVADATVKSADLTRDPKEKIERYERGVELYGYALQLADSCGLDDAKIGSYPPLKHVVRYLRRQQRKTTRRIEQVHEEQTDQAASVAALPVEDGPSSPVSGNVVPRPDVLLCTTCEVPYAREALVVDDADGCLYCQSCYDEYYASLELTEGASEDEEEEHETDLELKSDQTADFIQSVAPGIEGSHLSQEEEDEVPPAPQETQTEDVSESTRHELERDEEDTSGVSHERRVYNLSFLFSRQSKASPCPPELKTSIVRKKETQSSSNGHETSTRKRSTSGHSDHKKPPPPKTQHIVSMLPTLEDCEEARRRLGPTPRPLLDQMKALFDAPGTSAAESFETQLQLFSRAS
ncbi:hypothetical protein Poli38472_009287 [Pythium oligandrum]|uniref:Uncharacterized protein n=1 Tax=Pythium oligandrum TaxID=41045 RepID=A0A8K1CM25_PYTOL|nr:hypothetical protein Poli38472_009287 [Pythium oligandrum]|eukprot:TMW65120.1 hypothetical protein Poli38472_009287 [Pythium oligandrum]